MKKSLLFFLLLIVGGCQSLQKVAGNVAKPSLSISNVRVTDFNFNEVELTYDVKVNNPNPVALHMLGYDYNLKINGNNFVKGTEDKNLDIASSGNSTFQIPMRVNFQDLYHLFSGLKNKDSAGYKMLAHLDFNLPVIGKTKLPISKSGNLPMIKLPQISVANFTVDNVNLQRAKMNLKLNVSNPNGFGLLLNALNYSLDINGQHLISGDHNEQAKIARNSNRQISIPLSINLIKAGTSILQLLQNSNNAHYKLNGRLNFGADQPLLKTLKTNFTFDKTGKLSGKR